MNRILGDILRNTIGPYDPPERGFAAILYPNEKSPTPNYAWHPHLDGLWASKLPASADEIDDLNSPRADDLWDCPSLIDVSLAAVGVIDSLFALYLMVQGGSATIAIPAVIGGGTVSVKAVVVVGGVALPLGSLYCTVASGV